MKTFHDFVNEVREIPDAPAGEKFGYENTFEKPVTEKRLERAKFTHHSKLDDDHDVYARPAKPRKSEYDEDPDDFGDRHDHNFLVRNNKTGHVDKMLGGTMHPGKSFHIKLLIGRDKGTTRAHDLYHHLIDKHDHTMVATEQSEGGKRVWEKLAKKPGINIHGWDPHKDQPVNAKLGVDPTHASDDDAKHSDEEYSAKEMWLVAHKKPVRIKKQIGVHPLPESSKAKMKTFEDFMTEAWKKIPHEPSTDMVRGDSVFIHNPLHHDREKQNRQIISAKYLRTADGTDKTSGKPIPKGAHLVKIRDEGIAGKIGTGLHWVHPGDHIHKEFDRVDDRLERTKD